MARIFRYFIPAGVNFTKREAMAPLECENLRTEHFDAGQIGVKINDDGKVITDIIRAKFAILPESTEGTAAISQNLSKVHAHVFVEGSRKVNLCTKTIEVVAFREQV